MRVHVINLDRDTDRWARFQRLNSFLPDVVRFRAVEGAGVDRAALAANGFIAEPLTRSDAAMGCACSHIALWFQAVDNDEVVTILEDDSVLAPNFVPAANRFLERLPPDWGLVKWGWNFDSFVWAEIPEGVSLCRMAFDEEAMRVNLETFRTSHPSPVPIRLRHAFGTQAYTVSPTGARALLDAVLPMTDRIVSFPGFDVALRNASNDVDVNMVYPLIRAYACVPPLAVSENRVETSHTRGPLSGQ